jgi:anti-sigma regulatory factor (Ser/Thr protein kinase)
MVQMRTATEALDIDLYASPLAVSLARTYVDHRLYWWGCLRLTDNAQLIMAELVGNAVRATPGGEIRIRCSKAEGYVFLGVWDASPEMPKPKPVVELTLETLDLSPEHFDDNGGNGLLIVQSLATEYGISPTESPQGKWVWVKFEID